MGLGTRPKGDQRSSLWRTADTKPFKLSIDTRSLIISFWNIGSLTISAKDGSQANVARHCIGR